MEKSINDTMEEDNVLIAEFLGNSSMTISITKSGMKYHKSWDWLMSAVEKIESIHDEHHGYFQVFIHGNTCSIQGTNLHKAIEDLLGYGWVYMSDPNSIFETKIESTYHNVVEFIKWFNEHKK